MLRELAIQNFALIEDIQIRLGPGLTVFSGETGAGKTIIVQAIGLVLGGRADSQMIRTGAETAQVSAFFEIDPRGPAAAAMAQQGLDPSDGLALRRVISRSERTRNYLNGSVATAAMLSAITGHLAGISGQHGHQRLLRQDEHLLLLDRFGNLMDLRAQVGDAYHHVTPVLQNLANLRRRQEVQSQEQALLAFQRDEIREANLVTGEDEALEAERLRLRHGESLFQSAHDALENLYGQRGAVLEHLAAVEKRLNQAARMDPFLAGIGQGLHQAGILIDEAAAGLRDYLKGLQIDGQDLEQVEKRLDRINKLKRKYGGSLEAVLAHLAAVSAELDDVENISDRIRATEKNLDGLHANLAALADRLSKARRQAADRLARQVEGELADLKMAKTRFQVALSARAAGPEHPLVLQVHGNVISETGLDKAAFLIAPNVGEALKPLAAIASGGELSRVVLALKAILAENDSVPTVVFDEVDAGIGGAVAEVVGRKLARLARNHQILCITHLPQIARFGDSHLRLAKNVAQGRTTTVIEAVHDDQRVDELARMLGGETITAATLAHARELLQKSRPADSRSSRSKRS
jgi:DNA repair protein RecN (Recombination protein N)